MILHPCWYLVREEKTGHYDGWYSKKEDAKHACNLWSERRPDYEHYIETAYEKEMYYLKDRHMLNRVHDYA